MKILLIFLFLSLPVFGKEKFLPNSFSASFEQIYISSLTKKEKKSWGELSYKYPSNIRFEVEKPKKILFISNRQKSWVYRPPFIEGEKGEVTEKNTDGTGLTGLLDSLRMGLINNKLYRVTKGNGKAVLSFNSRSLKKFGVKESELIFKNKSEIFSDLSELRVTYPDGHKVSFKLSKIIQNQKFETSFFSFKTPKNTNISH
ncbi:MAG: hypothetical protein DRQ88_07895 [Epsilonproteobacteria bacterium]|nr:MAG: hypothetical protein DRQ88_07895 [Campylobacterota bacterium]